MECKCPNCKGPAKSLSLSTGEERIDCKTCGSFERQPDGTYMTCDPPRNDDAGGEGPDSPQPAPPVSQNAPSSVTTGDEGGGSPPPPEPADDEEDGGIEIGFTDEIDY
jgi:hypothetical protein